ncbi:hypothetical protein EUGRSUZ_L00338 [Eucalyptus grandis]|uniref:Uncharacterized protein n=2 Tax=Eucalyptus grandis TaxID=71139 RepID=A0ACC3L643_EUCGR|nr:hypothetical protein EUGRSUZ_L00338 [Eucalyptus grandis]
MFIKSQFQLHHHCLSLTTELYQFVEFSVDADEAISSSQRSPTRYGFPRFLSLQEFKNGYLEQNDSCEFGAEIFVIQSTKMMESFTLISYRPKNTFTYKFENWSKSGTDRRSREFGFENKRWKLLVYPKGHPTSKKESLSVYLEVQHLTEKMKVYAEFNLRVLDPLKKKNMEKPFECWLSASCPRKGDTNFMPQRDLKKKGFVQNDTLVVEVQISVVSKVDVSKRAGVR